jgi:polysaccharide pyruvyl transferase WcaK-like protein
MFISDCGYPDDQNEASIIFDSLSNVQQIRSFKNLYADNIEAWATCEKAIVTRLHAAVVCYSLGIPFVAIAYEPKVRGFCDSVGAVSVSVDSDPEEVISLFKTAIPLPVEPFDLTGYKNMILECVK